uniref:Uncharacterized protein n=1 Tax=Rhizophora mucronata TaxID=61149 RepID=A0A2P2PSA6_RHIMU
MIFVSLSYCCPQPLFYLLCVGDCARGRDITSKGDAEYK